MGYYYTVTFNYDTHLTILVKANDVIEAGEKAIEYCRANKYGMDRFTITEITRTAIMAIVE